MGLDRAFPRVSTETCTAGAGEPKGPLLSSLLCCLINGSNKTQERGTDGTLSYYSLTLISSRAMQFLSLAQRSGASGTAWREYP
jgi:hypothetical protein